MRPVVFIRISLRLSLQNTAELLDPNSLTQTGTKTGGGQERCSGWNINAAGIVDCAACRTTEYGHRDDKEKKLRQRLALATSTENVASMRTNRFDTYLS